MNKRTLRVLEFQKILEMLAAHATSQGAKKRCLRLVPRKDLTEIVQLQAETRDASRRWEEYGSVGFSGVRELAEQLRLLEMGSPLNQRELLDVASVLETADQVQAYGARREAQEPDTLTDRFASLLPVRDVSTEIRRCILSEEDMADDASLNLKKIRKEILTCGSQLHQQLEKIVKREADKGTLMDALITMRGGRYCIPVKAEYRAKFPGMIHDQSQTGSTVFIEPMEIVNLNNRIKELEVEEHLEIEAILVNLSQMAAAVRDEIHTDLTLLTDLDFIFAKAKFAKSIKASEPILNTDGIVELKRAVHPLLERSTAVPVDIKLGDEYTVLIITGPNTGGKTVSLKTLGLLTLMAQAGLHIPAEYGSRVSVFEDVFADIGDEQSIEQNLSTFSSHMSNIVYIIQHATEHSLCLFDEPGGGTDPVEGAALAVSILSDLKARGVRVMATTHYTELKTYALSEAGVENASCEFDVASLRPTYRLMIGIPGNSNAFAISRRLGLPEYIIESARASLDEDSVSMDQILTDLTETRRRMEKDQAELELYRKEAEELRKRLSAQEAKMAEKKEEILSKAREEARSLLDDAKETADAAIRDYQRWVQNPAAADARRMEEERAALRKKKEALADKKEKKPEKSGHKDSDFQVGNLVKVLSLDTEGRIVKLADSKGLFTVEMGILTSRFPASDLLILEEEKVKEKAPKVRAASEGSFNKSLSFRPELNLLGKTVDEALIEVDKFLDDALLAHVETVRIVHGKGTGALRRAIHEHLRKLRYVKSYRLGEYGEGDSGVTIVTL
ncbi:MAG: endonuclease MutS2 [Eubacterium sp.]|nr:endonuclease MutS2 [Eubacterium sp.]